MDSSKLSLSNVEQEDIEKSDRKIRLMKLILVLQFSVPLFMFWFYSYMLNGFKEHPFPKKMENLLLILYCVYPPILGMVSLFFGLVKIDNAIRMGSINPIRISRIKNLRTWILLGTIAVFSVYVIMVLGTLGS